MSNIPLSDVLAELRRELSKAQTAGANEAIKFAVEDVEVELQFATTREGLGEGSVKFWILESKAGLKATDAATQKLRLKLRVVDKDGQNIKPFSGVSQNP